ncbi:hypothetical protein Chor_010508 [Crotalus horridus]
MGAAREVEPPPAQDEEPDDEEEEEAAAAGAGDGEPAAGAASPWNIMIKHRLVQRRGRRSQMMTSFTDPVVSMDLLRAVLQPSINEEIQAVFGKYMKFFQKAAGNVRENVGEDVDTEQLIQETCRSCLEQYAFTGHWPVWSRQRQGFRDTDRLSGAGLTALFSLQAKLLFCDGKRPIARVPHELPAIKRAKPLEDEVSQQGSPIPKKVGHWGAPGRRWLALSSGGQETLMRGSSPWQRKGRPPGQSQPGDRGASGVSVGKSKSSEPVQRDGPKAIDRGAPREVHGASGQFLLWIDVHSLLALQWDPLRLTETTSFVLGSRANKALGMGGTRGRLYIKHPHLFKYAADPQDKHWLAQEQYMRATGGKMAYLLLEEDIQDLAASDEYRASQDLKLDELKPFTIPSWMIVKMQRYMKTLRSDGEQQLPQQQPLSLPEEMRET